MRHRHAVVGHALDKTFPETPVEIVGAWPSGKLKPCAPDPRIDSGDVEGVAHHRMSDPEASSGSRSVTHQNDLRPCQFHARGAGSDRRIKLEVSADHLGTRHSDLAEGHGDAERRGSI